jgi:Holliday junction resolvase RusA-like endonuclease
MTCYTLDIPRWRPALLNELMHSVKGKIRLKKRDREMVCAYAWQAKISQATGKRRVSLHVILGKGMREFDVDAPWKGLLDAMKHAKMIVDDSCKYVELGPVTFSRDWKNWGTRITIEDLED